ncbi:replication restart DNA helicase PriA [Williamsia limnetica]|uniref:Probable replication restart protein PriA n=1 Tax=Williamsia limnetica TaxID=882452 RepID=A0A318RTQ1_WILLI|nr:primosomal protein N' [Williamsia limnetica]PYE21029.1 replication restart DNA helicase PriA [Williamsia limnetica]
MSAVKQGRELAPQLPIARVLPVLGLAHLDRPFDYQVQTDQHLDAQPGVRVRVRFSGRLVDGFILERIEASDHPGKLGWLERVISAEPVLTPELAVLARAVADRYAGTMTDVLRLAIPARHARTEQVVGPPPGTPKPPTVDLDAWAVYQHSDSFLAAIAEGKAARAAWQVLPGEDWPARLAELACHTVVNGRSAIVVVPDQRDLVRLEAACEPLLGDRVVSLSAGLGPSARYRRWLRALRGQASVVIGTRSAAFAPVPDLGLIVVWDDGDDSLCEPRAPYPHTREVAVMRSHSETCALVLAGAARTAQTQALVNAGWAHDLTGARATVRKRTPRVQALSDEDNRITRDPLARSARIPAVAFDAARAAIAADAPVLFSVPRRGYLPSLACERCRAQVRCRRCHGPMQADGPGAAGGAHAGSVGSLSCRWCGHPEANFRCAECGFTKVRALTTGARRTAEELGRAFPGVPVLTSGGDKIVDAVEGGARVVVSTPGAEPVADGGYGAVILLDTWAQLDRPELRAGEEAVRRWLSAGLLVRPHGDGGALVIVADAGLAPVQAVIRWDPVGFAEQELSQRTELAFPPAVTMASIDGEGPAILAFAETVELPAGGELLGPVELPPGVRLPSGLNRDEVSDPQRILLRCSRAQGRELAAALHAAQVARNAQHESAPIRVQMDPPTIG